jgi:MOSC domain-containing protein YiiM
MQLRPSIFQINASRGGVPKRPVPFAEVGELGLSIDKQTHTHVHGGPERALCLYALERIMALQSEGHPIYPGAVGENITLSGVDWDTCAKTGARLRLGREVLIELTQPAVPCNQIIGAFKDGDSTRISDRKHPGWARMYARVLNGGTIHIGDEVSIEA